MPKGPANRPLPTPISIPFSLVGKRYLIALSSDSYELHHYLDLETGRVVMVDDEIRGRLEEIYGEIYDLEGNRVVSLEKHLQGRDDLMGWVKEMLLEADRVEQGYGERFISVERDDPHQDYRDMERFIATVEDPDLQDRLWRAIRGRGAFRYFKDVLYDYPDVRQRWFEFKDARTWQRTLDWLDYFGIEPITSDS